MKYKICSNCGGKLKFWRKTIFNDSLYQCSGCSTLLVIPNKAESEECKCLRIWTDEEIWEAQAIIAQLLLAYKRICPMIGALNDYRQGAIIYALNKGKMISAKCCPTDTWNYWIGTMVVLCKAAGRELPGWIRREESK